MISPHFEVTGEEAKNFLPALVAINEEQLRANPDWPSVRSLIKRGELKYRLADPQEHWQTYRDLITQGQANGVAFADCEDLASAVAAEDRVRHNIQTEAYAYKPKPGLFHVVAAVPNAALREGRFGSERELLSGWPNARGASRPGFTLQDPSVAAGMGSSFSGIQGKPMSNANYSGRGIGRALARGMGTGMTGGRTAKQIGESLGGGLRSGLGLGSGFASDLGSGLGGGISAFLSDGLSDDMDILDDVDLDDVDLDDVDLDIEEGLEDDDSDIYGAMYGSAGSLVKDQALKLLPIYYAALNEIKRTGKVPSWVTGIARNAGSASRRLGRRIRRLKRKVRNSEAVHRAEALANSYENMDQTSLKKIWAEGARSAATSLKSVFKGEDYGADLGSSPSVHQVVRGATGSQHYGAYGAGQDELIADSLEAFGMLCEEEDIFAGILAEESGYSGILAKARLKAAKWRQARADKKVDKLESKLEASSSTLEEAADEAESEVMADSMSDEGVQADVQMTKPRIAKRLARMTARAQKNIKSGNAKLAASTIAGIEKVLAQARQINLKLEPTQGLKAVLRWYRSHGAKQASQGKPPVQAQAGSRNVKNRPAGQHPRGPKQHPRGPRQHPRGPRQGSQGPKQGSQGPKQGPRAFQHIQGIPKGPQEMAPSASVVPSAIQYGASRGFRPGGPSGSPPKAGSRGPSAESDAARNKAWVSRTIKTRHKVEEYGVMTAEDFAGIFTDARLKAAEWREDRAVSKASDLRSKLSDDGGDSSGRPRRSGRPRSRSAHASEAAYYRPSDMAEKARARAARAKYEEYGAMTADDFDLELEMEGFGF